LHRYYDLLNLGRRYTCVGSSDSHKMTNEWAGYPRTYVRVADDRPGAVTAEELAAALKAGHAVVSLGPFVEAHVGEAGPGDTVRAAPGTVPLDVTVRSADWVNVSRVEIVENGDTVFGFDIAEEEGTGNVRWARTVDVPVSVNSWIMVVVTGTRTVDEVLPGLHVAPFAFTNPIYVDVDEPTEQASRRPVRRRATRAPFAAEEAPQEQPAQEPEEGEDASLPIDAAGPPLESDAAAAGQPPPTAPVPPDN
jgi:hypothetical protein